MTRTPGTGTHAMNVLIAYGHLEPRSFCAAMLHTAVQAFSTGVVATDGLPQACDGSGHDVPIETVLYPIQRGILAFCGLEVLPPSSPTGRTVDHAWRREPLAACGSVWP